jgi:hypothetical protein
MPDAPSLPNFTGIWKLNLEKSTIRGPQPKQVLMNIEHHDPILIQQVLLTDANGAEQRQVFTCRIGTEVKNSVGGLELRSGSQWNGQELVIESRMNARGREFYFKDHWSLSEGGRILTMEHRDDDLAGQISVLEKMPDAASKKFADF